MIFRITADDNVKLQKAIDAVLDAFPQYESSLDVYDERTAATLELFKTCGNCGNKL